MAHDVVTRKHAFKRLMPTDYFGILNFMSAEGGIGLSGANLMVFALVYSYSHDHDASDYFGSANYAATRLGISRASVQAAFKALLEQGLICVKGERKSPKGKPMKVYSVSEDAVDRAIAEFEVYWADEEVAVQPARPCLGDSSETVKPQDVVVEKPPCDNVQNLDIMPENLPSTSHNVQNSDIKGGHNVQNSDIIIKKDLDFKVESKTNQPVDYPSGSDGTPTPGTIPDHKSAEESVGRSVSISSKIEPQGRPQPEPTHETDVAEASSASEPELETGCDSLPSADATITPSKPAAAFSDSKPEPFAPKADLAFESAEVSVGRSVSISSKNKPQATQSEPTHEADAAEASLASEPKAERADGAESNAAVRRAEAETVFTEMWVITRNRNRRAAASPAYNALLERGYEPGEIKRAWEERIRPAIEGNWEPSYHPQLANFLEKSPEEDPEGAAAIIARHRREQAASASRRRPAPEPEPQSALFELAERDEKLADLDHRAEVAAKALASARVLGKEGDALGAVERDYAEAMSARLGYLRDLSHDDRAPSDLAQLALAALSELESGKEGTSDER